jgi:diacylglycerol O-acyltransferase / wax synthase
MASPPRSLSDLDALLFAADTPAQPLHVMAAVVLEGSSVAGPWDYDRFQARIAERVHRIDPLRSRPVWGATGRPLLIDDPSIDLQHHLHHITLPEGGGIEALAEAASDIAAEPLPKNRPLWAAWFVEGFEKDRAAVIAKIHHSAVDGVFGIFALAGFFDLDPSPTLPESPPAEQLTPTGLSQLAGARVGALRQRPAVVAKAVRQAAAAATELPRMRGSRPPLPLTAPRMSYNRPLTSNRSVAFTTLDFEEVRRVGRAFGASVNDVVVALCAGVLRRYGLQCGDLQERPLVATIPVSERESVGGSAGNQLTFMFYELPVHLDDPGERLRFVQRSAGIAKDARARAGAGLLSSVATLIPKIVVGPAMRVASSLRVTSIVPPIANVMISSLRGPEVPLFASGARVSSIFPLGPVIEGIGLCITAISYGEGLAFGLIACADHIVDIRDLATGLHLEMVGLLDASAESSEDSTE